MSRETAYRIFKFFFNLCIVGTFGGALAGLVLEYAAPEAIGPWGRYAGTAIVILMAGMFLSFLICRLFFDDLRRAEAEKWSRSPNSIRLGMTIVTAACAVFFASGYFRMGPLIGLVAVGVTFAVFRLLIETILPKKTANVDPGKDAQLDRPTRPTRRKRGDI
jgi:hypothetical protein